MFHWTDSFIWKRASWGEFWHFICLCCDIRALSLLRKQTLCVLWSLFFESIFRLLKRLIRCSFARTFSTTLVSIFLTYSCRCSWKVSRNCTHWRLVIISLFTQIQRLISFSWTDCCYFLLSPFRFCSIPSSLLALMFCVDSKIMSAYLATSSTRSGFFA